MILIYDIMILIICGLGIFFLFQCIFNDMQAEYDIIHDKSTAL